MADSDQLGMFGVPAPLPMHRVAAHTRMLADGSETFVAEHLRWNRPRRKALPPSPRTPRQEGPDPAQLSFLEP